jgi:[ribosomal protein S5]-alanine N-acetyltransferase
MRTRVEPVNALASASVGLRRFHAGDVAKLPALCNDSQLARNVRDTFPHPYGPAQALFFVDNIASQNDIFAIEWNGDVVGAVGGHFKTDVYRDVIEVGYWVGRAWWGRGVASASGALLAQHLEATQPTLLRLEADVFGGNLASARVLEKNGFVREGTRRGRIRKDGLVRDEWLYARVLAGA